MKKKNFNDSWLFGQSEEELTPVTVPHDAMIHRERKADMPSGSAQAFFPGGKYVYQKKFMASRAEHTVFEFEGVYKNAKVFINGKEAGGCEYGYLPFFIAADDYIIDGENTICVKCDNVEQPDSRWYTGAGMYRPVWMWTGGKEAIAPWGIKITTISVDPAVVRVETECEGTPVVKILDGDIAVAEGTGRKVELTVPNAKLWDAENPNLYTCMVTLGDDTVCNEFGIRIVTWDKNGLYINGKSILLRGGCVHHDNGILGAATWDESEYRRVKKLKDAGFNAIRSSHNPASRAMLEACDRLGIYVMDESWDMWFLHKSQYDYATHWRKNYLNDLKVMAERDYNHPSVIMYSIGNEVSEPAKEEGMEKTKEMVDYMHKIDPSRPVTAGFNLMIITKAKKGKNVYKEEGGRDDSADQKMQGMNSTMFNFITNIVGTGMNKAANSKKADEATSPCLDALDIAGYNYASGRYPLEGKAHPGRLILGSETFPQDIVKNWKMVKEYPYLVGDFMWTAWDYLGEVGLGAWAYTKDGTGFNKPYPWLLADTGAFDIIGEPNGELFLAQAAWGWTDKPLIGVQPVNHPGVKPAKMTWRGTNAIASWSWQSCNGNRVIVEVYAAAAEAELFLNGKSLGRKKIKECKASFKTVYAEGELKAISYDENGKICGENYLVSATGKKRLAITADTERAKIGQLVYVEISIVGENSVVESNADCTLNVSVTGGKLEAFGSANPRTKERFDSGSYTTYYGKALAAVVMNAVGEAVITVTDGEEKAEVVIPVTE